MLACNLHEYYRIHPDHRLVINKVPAFCAGHAGLLAYQSDKSGGKLTLPNHCCSFLRKCCEKKGDHQGFLHSKFPDGAVHCQHGQQCSFGHWERIVAQAKGKAKGKDKREGKGEGMAMVTATLIDSVAARLALHIRGAGGSLRGGELGQYYKAYPAHSHLISSLGLKGFCNAYDGLFTLEKDGNQGRLCLASFCCHYLRDVCMHKKEHSGKRHAKPASSLVLCSLGSDCQYGHWQKIIEASTLRIAAVSAGTEGKGEGKGKSLLPPTQNWQKVGETSSLQIGVAAGSMKGKGAGKEGKVPTPHMVAASLALYMNENGGSLRGSEVGDYYKLRPSHKELISSPGLKSFLSSYDGLFTFEPDKDSGRLHLASFCCYFLRDACNSKKDHQGKRHAKPSSALVACSLRADCQHGHWQRIVETAAGKGANKPASQSTGSAEIEMPVSQIRWSHNSVRVVFQDARLVAMMLKELLDGTLLVEQIPEIEVVEDDGLMYAWTGNRRIWVLKEFERLRKVAVKVKVKKIAGKLPKKSPKFSTTNSGESVTFFSQKRDDNFPSMSFALAALNPSTAPSAWDVELGNEVRKCNSLPFWKIQRISELSVWQVPPPDQELLEYLQGKPYLFVVNQGAVDQVVTLTGCMDALKLLGFDAHPSVKISSLESFEDFEAVEEDRAEFLQDPDAYSSQSAEEEAVGGHSASSLEEALRSVCSAQPLSLFSLPDLVGVPNNADTCGELLSFLKQRKHIFNVSSSLFGHTVALLEPDLHAEGDGADGVGMEAPNLPVGPGDHVTDSGARASDDVGQISLSSHLYSVINDAGGSLNLALLEWEEVCFAEFASKLELETYLQQQPQFRVWDSEDGKMVSLTASSSSDECGSKIGAAATGSRWGRAARQAEGESLPSEDVAMLEEQTYDVSLERRFSGCEEIPSFHDRKEPIREVGELVHVTKHSSMGCAVVSLTDCQMRQAILAEGEQQVIAGVQVEIKAHRKKDTLEDVPTDIFVAWGRQAEKNFPLSETEILKYFESKCREISLQSTQLRAEAPAWEPQEFGAWEPADAAEPELPMAADPDPSDLSSPKRCEDEDAGALRMLLPARLSREISMEVLAILQSSAHRLLYQVDSPMKVALRSGWYRGKLPATVLAQRDVEEVAKRLGWKDLGGTVPIPGSPHRVTFGIHCDRLRSVTVHVGRYLPGLWQKACDLLEKGSTIFVGPVGCGKTTILRDVAVNLSKDLQVLVVDFTGHLADISCDVAYLSAVDGDVQVVRRAIREHVPEVIVAEFLDTYAALQAGRACDEAGVRLACSVASNLQFLVESFVHAYSGPRRMRDLACLTFPFASAVLLSRQTEEWTVYPNAPAVVCSRGRDRLPKCELHHVEVSPRDLLDPSNSPLGDQGEVDQDAEDEQRSDGC